MELKWDSCADGSCQQQVDLLQVQIPFEQSASHIPPEEALGLFVFRCAPSKPNFASLTLMTMPHNVGAPF